MKKQLKKYVYILFLCLCFQSYGQQIDVSSPPKQMQPGQFFSLFFNLSNTNVLPLGFQHKLVLPNNWKILTEKKVILDSVNIKYIYTISTPNQESAGAYPIDFQINIGDTTLLNKKITANLGEVRHVEIVPLNQPEFVKEGDILRVEYLIQNLGNRAERVKLETTRGIVENTKDSVVINPNSFLKVFVKQTIPQTELPDAWQTSSDLRVRLSNDNMPIFQAVSIPVYSTKIKKNDPYLRFPIEIGGGYMSYTLGDKTVGAYQYFADGRGYVDFAKKHFVDISARGPNQFAFPAIGNYDHYSVAYTYLSKINIVVGDYVLRYNNLMEFGRYGRGAKYEQTNGKKSFMAFYQQSRFFPNQKNAFGGSYKVNLKGESNIGVNFISKELIFSHTQFRSNILGLSSFTKKQNLTNETEIAVGYAQNKLDIGFFNKFNIRHKQLIFNSEIIHAGKNFYGFYTNSLLFVNNLNYYLTKKINIGINSNITRINPSLDVLRYAISPYSTTFMGFVSYQPNERHLLFLNLTKQEREDRQRPSTFHFKEDFGNLAYTLNTSRFSLFSQVRYGYTKNLLTTDSTNRKSATSFLIQPSVALFPWFWVGTYIENQHTSKFSNLDQYQNLFYYGANMRLNIRKNISLNFMYRNNYAPDELFEKRSFMDGSLIIDYGKHLFSVQTGRAYLPNLTTNDQNTFFLSAKYLYRLNVPLKKDKKLGHLRGQILCLSDSIKKEGILIQVGQYKVLTDSNGLFSFPNLMPNKYHVLMPNNSNLVGVVSTLKTPIEVIMKADSTVFLTIPLIKTGGVIGHIGFEKTETAPSVKPTIYIKLSNGNESFMTELNDKNEFSFKEMKPGVWKLKAIVVGKNEQFEILNPEQEVEIESGQIKQSTFAVKTMQRKIQFSGKSFQISAEKK